MANNIILLGPPGSGKGTQSALLSKSLEIPSISTGDALRTEVANNSEIGIIAKKFMNDGGLVPDDVVLDIVKIRLSKEDCNNGFILDGFPRNINQAIGLNEILKSIQKEITLVIDFVVPDDVLIKRISGRFFCKKCGTIYNDYYKKTAKEGVCDECNATDFDRRSDDRKEVVENRLKVYHATIADLVEYYQKNNLIYSLDALKYSPLILQELLAVINKK